MPDNNVVQTFREGIVEAVIGIRESNQQRYCDISFRRAFVNKQTGESGYAYTFSAQQIAELMLDISLAYHTSAVAPDGFLSADQRSVFNQLSASRRA